MPRKFLKRWIPDTEHIIGHPNLRFFGTLLADPNLFHLNRRSVSGAFAVGLFIAFLPMPAQMAAAAAVAILVRVNLPISVVMVWVSNPATLPPILLTAYTLGKRVMNEPLQMARFEPSLEWVLQEFGRIWQPLLIGSLIMSTIAAIVGFVVVRVLWRISVSQQIRLRRIRHAALPPRHRPRDDQAD